MSCCSDDWSRGKEKGSFTAIRTKEAREEDRFLFDNGDKRCRYVEWFRGRRDGSEGKEKVEAKVQKMENELNGYRCFCCVSEVD